MTEDLKAEMKQVARTLVSLRFPIDNPAFNVAAVLNEPVERISLADFYNGPGAAWVRLNTRLIWQPIEPSELEGVSTVRDLGKLCVAHLGPAPAPTLDVLAGETP